MLAIDYWQKRSPPSHGLPHAPEQQAPLAPQYDPEGKQGGLQTPPLQAPLQHEPLPEQSVPSAWQGVAQKPCWQLPPQQSPSSEHAKPSAVQAGGGAAASLPAHAVAEQALLQQLPERHSAP